MRKGYERKGFARRGLALLAALTLMLLTGAAALGEENRIWQRGDTGETVTWIQERLRDLNYLNREPTGVFDEETEQALLTFQQWNGLLATGMADAVTMARLASEDGARVFYEEDVPGEYEAVEDGLAESAWPMATGMPFASSSRAASNGYVAAKGSRAEDIAWNTEEFTRFESNRFVSTAVSPLSTFAADVDTSSYAQLRRRVLEGVEIPPDSVRVEEMLNYFHYDYAQPEGDEPLKATVEMGPCPWNEKTRLLLIGLQARQETAENRPPHHLVFLIDTSGSMEGRDRLDLVKRAFLLLLEELGPEDRVSIVAYASQDRVVLENVSAAEKTTIMEAISELEAGGATNGTAGLTRAYEVAERHYLENGVNRILMATDGDLNVGPSGEGDLARLVTEKKKAGVSLTCLGFGLGNYKDNKMEALADYGDGNCRYIDTIHEARKALVEEAGGTFITVAKDVKIQVDFNPAYIAGYRLIGYEDRLMAAEDFADDEKDGGEIGSGHQVTALYEIVTADSDYDFGETKSRYAGSAGEMLPEGEWLTVAVRAKEPQGTESRLWETPVTEALFRETLSDNLRFAAAVAEAAMLLRESEWKGTSSWAQALSLARGCESVTGDPYREEFVYLLTRLEREE